ncbi:hypothetical protein [Pseudonocardia sp.]|uniref:hypothetical protein n=1 Tax=Pseudonocardia sp. TaxID=60912 RepID=UPI0031FD08C7
MWRLLFARGALNLTVPELRRFWEDYMALYERHARAAASPTQGARRVLVRFVAFPEV